MNRPLSAIVGAIEIAVLGVLLAALVSGCAGIRNRPAPPPVEEVAPATETAPVLDIDQTYQAISLSVKAGDPDAAIAAYQNAQLANPDDPATRILLANLYLIAGSLDEAQKILDEVLSRDAENTDALFLSSLLAAATGNRDREIDLLNRILEIDPGHGDARASLGELQLADREFEKAAANFSAALETDGDSLVARMGLANVYLREEKYDEATDELTDVIAVHPDYPFAYADRARARAMQYQLGAATEDLSVAIELDPDYSWHYLDRGRVYREQGQYELAESDFSRAIALDDSQFITYISRGRVRDALGREDEALADYMQGLGLRPDYYPAYEPAATLLFIGGQYAEAASYYEKALSADPRRLEFVLLAALARMSAGDEQGADDWLNSSLAQFPRDSLIYSMARFYLLPSNEGYIESEIQREPNDTVRGQMYFYLGALLSLQGRDATAQAALLEAEDLLAPGILEGRLASRLLEPYRTGNPTGESGEEGL